MKTDPLGTDDMTEVRDVTVTRVDLVDKAANGTPFLLMKAADGGNLMSTDVIESLLKSSEERTMTASEPVTKADDITIDAPLVEPGGAAAIDAATPSSAGWEQVDADSAANWYGVLTRAKNALALLAGREATEAATGDDDDILNSWNLEDAACAIDYALDILATYQMSEQAESDMVSDVQKSLAKFSLPALAEVESFGALLKAGRTISAANEGKLKSASDSILDVLASLPAAPETITKEAKVAEVTALEEIVVEKADGDAATLTAVFDSTGKLLGVIADPSVIQPVAGAGGGDDVAVDDVDDTPDAAAVPDMPVEPDGVVKSAEVPLTLSTVEDLIKSALATERASQVEVVKALTDEIESLKAPARSRVVTNGAAGRPAGRDGEVLTGGSTNAAALRKASDDAPDAITKKKIDDQRMGLAVDMLKAQMYPGK